MPKKGRSHIGRPVRRRAEGKKRLAQETLEQRETRLERARQTARKRRAQLMGNTPAPHMAVDEPALKCHPAAPQDLEDAEGSKNELLAAPNAEAMDALPKDHGFISQNNCSNGLMVYKYRKKP